MKLIKYLGKRKNRTGFNLSCWGLFWCPYCDKEVEKDLSNGRRQKSCGCNRIIHGETGTRLYVTWHQMKRRCLEKNNKDYKNYGRRGIKVCKKWLKYILFRNWAIDNGYKNDLTIDRIDNDGNYEPNNCRWISRLENSRNRRTNKVNIKIVREIRDKYSTGEYLQKDLAMEYKVDPAIIHFIVKNKTWKENIISI